MARSPGDGVADSSIVPEPETIEYEPPRVNWEEDFPTTVFGVSCAKQPGNPGCVPGPAFS